MDWPLEVRHSETWSRAPERIEVVSSDPDVGCGVLAYRLLRNSIPQNEAEMSCDRCVTGTGRTPAGLSQSTIWGWEGLSVTRMTQSEPNYASAPARSSEATSPPVDSTRSISWKRSVGVIGFDR